MVKLKQATKDRYTKGVRKYKKILEKAKNADINESDTVTIITDILADVFGYEKFENITSEYAIKKTYCDLAIKIDDKVKLLVECKAIGIKLKNDFVRQATNYAANEGIEWVILTNGIEWEIYNIVFTQPIENKLIAKFDFTKLDLKNDSDLMLLCSISIEAFKKNAKYTLQDIKDHKEILNKHFVGQVVMSDAILDAIRKQVKKLAPELKTTNEDIGEIIINEILKRDIVESDEAEYAKKKLNKLLRASTKTKAK